MFGVNAACWWGSEAWWWHSSWCRVLPPAWERCSVLLVKAAGDCGCHLPGTCARFPLNKEKATPEHLLSLAFDLLHVPPAKRVLGGLRECLNLVKGGEMGDSSVPVLKNKKKAIKGKSTTLTSTYLQVLPLPLQHWDLEPALLGATSKGFWGSWLSGQERKSVLS